MGVDIGTLTGRIELVDGTASVIGVFKNRLGEAERALQGVSTGALGVAGALVGVGAAAIGAMTGVGALITKLGDAGAAVGDITEQFDKLTKKAGMDAPRALEAMRKGTANTVDDMTLMKSTLRMLSAGFKGSADDMLTMTQAARVLSERGMSLESAFGLVTQAMTTGRTRALAMQGVVVDLAKATKDYKEETEESGGAVNATGALQAKQKEILKGLTGLVKENGEVITDFADRTAAARVQFTNFNNEVSRRVSESPKLNAALDRVGAALQRAFGSASTQETVEKFVKWIERAGDIVADFAVNVIDWFVRWQPTIQQAAELIWDVLIKAWDALSKAVSSVTDIIKGAWNWFDSLPGPVKKLSIGLLELALAFKALNLVLEALYATHMVRLSTEAARMLIVFKWEAVTMYANSITATLIPALTTLATTIAPIAITLATIHALWNAEWKKPAFLGGEIGDMDLVDPTSPAGMLARQQKKVRDASLLASKPLLAFAGLSSVKPGSMGVGAGVPDIVPAAELSAEALKKLKDAIDTMSGAKLIADTKELTVAYDSLVKKGLAPTNDALVRYRDALRDTLALYDKKTKQTADGIGLSQYPPELVERYKEINAEVEKLERKKNWDASISDGLKKIRDDAAAARIRIKDLADTLDAELAGMAAINSARDLVSALGAVVGKSDDWSKVLASQVRPSLDTVNAAVKTMLERGDAIPESMSNAQIKLAGMASQASMTALSMNMGLIPATETYVDALGVQVPALRTVHDAMGNLIGVNLRADGTFDRLNTLLNTSTERTKGLGSALRMLGDVFDNINSRFGQLVQVASKGWDVITNTEKVKNPNYVEGGTEPAEIAQFSMGDKMVAGLGVAKEAIDLFVTGSNRVAVATRGMMTGAVMGVGAAMALGTAWGAAGGPIGLAVGAIAGAVAGLVISWNAAGNAARNANRAADKELQALRDGLIKTYGSLENIDILGKQLGVDLKGAWGDTTVAGLEHFSKLIDEFEEKMKNLQESLQRYKLDWTDLGDEMKRFFGANYGGKLVDDFNDLVNSGVKVEKVVTGMSDAISDYIVESVRAGTKVPAAMQPIIVKMIEMGTLTDAAAKAILGLADAAMPTLADIKEAADRYGLSLDALGPKVQQLSINEAAAQIAADWKILTAAGTDISVILSSMNPEVKGMGEQVQALVTQAMKFGLELPSAMKPILQAMVDAGTLTDDTGKKLEDLSGLTFAADLSKMFDELMTKLGELIDVITDGVGGALDGLGKKVIEPRISPKWDVENSDWTPDAYAGGGVVYAAGGWKPQGSDTVPAMLTPGERVLTVAENRDYGKPIYINNTVNLDGKVVAKNQMKHIPGQLANAGL